MQQNYIGIIYRCKNLLIWSQADVLFMRIFLRTARSFYGSLWYLRTHLRTHLRTYLRTYVQVIFEGSHPTLKLTKQKMSEIIQVNVPNFFYFDEIPKMTKLGPKNRFWDLKFKTTPSGCHPLNILYFSRYRLETSHCDSLRHFEHSLI